jgi:phenylacetic acid degradation operon negative regulatory protein
MSKIKRNIKKEHRKRRVRTITIILTLFGSYVNPRGGKVWVGSLIKLLEPFGLSSNAIRLALSRMSKQNLIQSQKIDRKSYYSLTTKGTQWMLYGQRWTLEKECKPWDKKWRLLVYSVPEESRYLRDKLREELKGMGFGSLSSSLWISPFNFKEKMAKLFGKIKVAGYVETFEAKYTGLVEGRELAARAWDIRGLEERYREFIGKYSPIFVRHKERMERKETIALGECFAERFRVTAEYIEIALYDPMLPLELLPDDWAGISAKNICLEYRKLLAPEANKFVDSILRDSKVLKESIKKN